MACADWLVKLQISCAIYFWATGKKMASGLHPWQVKKLSKYLIVCGVYYLIVLVVDIYLAASRLSKYPPLATSTSVNSC